MAQIHGAALQVEAVRRLVAQTVEVLVLVGKEGDAGGPEIAALVAVIAELRVERQLAELLQNFFAVAVIDGLAVLIQLGAHRAGFQHGAAFLGPRLRGRFLRQERPVLLDQLAGGSRLETDAVLPAGGEAGGFSRPHKENFVVFDAETHKFHLAFSAAARYAEKQGGCRLSLIQIILAQERFY